MNPDNELGRALVLERQVADLQADLEKTEFLLTKANALARSMHEAAMGAVTPTRRGWVGDIEDLRAERDMLIQRIMDSKPPALQAKLDAAEAERDRLQKIVNVVDDVLVVNWIAVPPGGDYKKALHDLITINIDQHEFFKAEQAKEKGSSEEDPVEPVT